MIVEAASDEYDDTENSKKQNASEYVNVPIEQKHLNRIVRHGLGKNSLGGFPSWMVRYASICIRFAEFERKKLPQHLRKQIMKRKTQLMENAKKHGVNVAAAQEAAAEALRHLSVHAQPHRLLLRGAPARLLRGFLLERLRATNAQVRSLLAVGLRLASRFA